MCKKSDLKLREGEPAATRLPKRLIDVGLDQSSRPRIVDTAGQMGHYAALSYSWGSPRVVLTKSNIHILQQQIEPSEMPEYWPAAFEVSRSLGIRYLWVDSLCIIQDDPEERTYAISKMFDIFSLATLTICESGEYTFGSHADGSILMRPFSFFLDWSQPAYAKTCASRLQTPIWSVARRIRTLHILNSSCDAIVGRIDGLLQQLQEHNGGNRKADISDLMKWLLARGADLETHYQEPKASDVDTEDPDIFEDALEFIESKGMPDKADVHANAPTYIGTFTDLNNAESDDTTIQLKHGIRLVEAGKLFEALAAFMGARDHVSAFSGSNLVSRGVYADASMNIALVYHMQDLSSIAFDVVETALKTCLKLPALARSLGRLHFTMGRIQDALGNRDESLACYETASMSFRNAPKEEPQLADWRAVLNLKLAEHHVRTKDFRSAQ